MKWSTMAASAALTVGIVGCDQLEKIPFLSRGDTDTASVDTTTLAEVPPDTQVMQPEPAQAQPQTAPTRPRPQRASGPLADEPWTPTDTGTVRPGMSRSEVIAVWGPPVAESQETNRTYLYFRNGCEVTCGTFDVVFLEGDQVVDAIVRGRGHTYAGVSSSPDDRPAEFTPPRPENSMDPIP